MMFDQNIETLLHEITLQAIGKLIGIDEDITHLLYALTGASACRQIVGFVQFEEDGQRKIDESETWYVGFRLKLAPSLCAVAYSNGGELNEASWEFAIPNVNTMAFGTQPANAIDYLALGRVTLDMDDEEGYTYECLREVLERTAH